ncbi:MAG: dihydroorotase family protein [Methanomassiliicoccaceae archaeon]|nr:dihydroorotase family protein [Methanomassiliicoccaceae archaeon]
MGPELVIAGRALIGGELKETEIGITDGKIVFVGPKADRGGDRIDIGTSRIVLPGGIDPHVHFRDPGMTQKEDFGTGSTSAICGGITCVLDMPNTKPPAMDIESIRDKKARLRRRSYCDYGLFGAITKNRSPAKIAPLVAGFKLFMGSTTGDILTNNDSVIARASKDIIGSGKVLSVHAEDNNFLLHEPEYDCMDHLRNRPAAAEMNAIGRLSPYKGMKINICHITTAESLALASSLGFTTEVTMHHLMFDAGRGKSTQFKVNPPLRDIKTRESLYKSFEEGSITMIGSDHAPHTADEKSQEFDYAPSGIPGIETTMPIMMHMVRMGTISLQRVAEMCSAAPARVFGMNKGAIEVGKDADLSIFDLRNSEQISVMKMHSKAGYTPYDGWSAVFPNMVLLRGEVQLQDGEFCGEAMGEDIIG